LVTPVDLELEKLCGKKPGSACLERALNAIKNGESELVQLKYAQRACESGYLPSACGVAGDIIRHQQKNYKQALKYDQDACNQGDDIGCYNAACDFCQLGDSSSAFKYLGWAIDLGYIKPDHIQSDAELNCVRKMSGYAALLERSKKNPRPLSASAGSLFLSKTKLVVSPLYKVGFEILSQDPMIMQNKGTKASLSFELNSAKVSEIFVSIEKIAQAQLNGNPMQETSHAKGFANFVPFESKSYEFTATTLSFIRNVRVFDLGDIRVIATLTYSKAFEKDYGPQYRAVLDQIFTVPHATVKRGFQEQVNDWIKFPKVLGKQYTMRSQGSLGRVFQTPNATEKNTGVIAIAANASFLTDEQVSQWKDLLFQDSMGIKVTTKTPWQEVKISDPRYRVYSRSAEVQNLQDSSHIAMRVVVFDRTIKRGKKFYHLVSGVTLRADQEKNRKEMEQLAEKISRESKYNIDAALDKEIQKQLDLAAEASTKEEPTSPGSGALPQG